VSNRAMLECPSCRVQLQSLGPMAIRTGGSGGKWHLLLGDFADLDEQVSHLNTYRCPRCGHIEFYDHGFTLTPMGSNRV
jgi:predicted nucleic-acid-binding Zn-ribbon protein